MPYGEQLTIPGLHVVGDLSAKQYHAVKLSTDTAGAVIALAATTDAVIGVLQNAPDAANERPIVAAEGISTMVAGTSTITAGATLTPDSTGRAITGGSVEVAQAVEAAGAVGDEIMVVLK